MGLTILIAGLILLLGVHSLRIAADGWRSAQLARLGEARWKGLYSLASLLGLALILWGYAEARAGAPLLWQAAPWSRHLVALCTLPAFVLLLAAYIPGTRIKERLGHPLLAGVVLWSGSHLPANGAVHALLLFGGFCLWSLADFASSRRRDREAGRRYPAAPGWWRDALVLIAGIAAWWLFARYGHLWLVGVQPLL